MSFLSSPQLVQLFCPYAPLRITTPGVPVFSVHDVNTHGPPDLWLVKGVGLTRFRGWEEYEVVERREDVGVAGADDRL